MENIQIKSFDEAIKHLSESVVNIARGYQPQDHDDITQECWLHIFRLIHGRGSIDSSLLIRGAQYAAEQQSRLLSRAGLTPRRSKFRQPTQLSYIPDRPHEEPLDTFIRDLLLDTHGSQHAVVEAARLIVSDGRKPTQAAIAEMLGITRKKVRYHIEKLRKRYDDKDND